MFREGREAGDVNCGDGTLPSFRTEVYQRLGDLAAIRGACVLFGRRRSGIAASPLEKRRTEFAPKADKLNLSQRRFLCLLWFLFAVNEVWAVDPVRHISQYAHTARRIQMGSSPLPSWDIRAWH